jgi:hypothetical protein
MGTKRLPLSKSRWKAGLLPLRDSSTSAIEFRRVSTTEGKLSVDERRAGFREFEITEKSVLAEFMELASGTPKEIADFASEYGPLQLCGQHGLPVHHIPERALPWVDEDTYNTHSVDVINSQLSITEHPYHWSRLARQAKAMQRLAVTAETWGEKDPSADEPPPSDDLRKQLEEDWQVITNVLNGVNPRKMLDPETESPVIDLPSLSSGQILRRRTAAAVQLWLEWGNVRTRFEWNEHEDPRIRWGADNLFGLLALQLALDVAHSEDFAICSGCFRPFFTSRLKRRGKNRWCGDENCMKLKARREQRQLRARRRDAAGS